MVNEVLVIETYPDCGMLIGWVCLGTRRGTMAISARIIVIARRAIVVASDFCSVDFHLGFDFKFLSAILAEPYHLRKCGEASPALHTEALWSCSSLTEWPASVSLKQVIAKRQKYQDRDQSD